VGSINVDWGRSGKWEGQLGKIAINVDLKSLPAIIGNN